MLVCICFLISSFSFPLFGFDLGFLALVWRCCGAWLMFSKLSAVMSRFLVICFSVLSRKDGLVESMALWCSIASGFLGV